MGASFSRVPKDDLSVGIIGAGFSGLCMGIQLKKAGFNNFTIFEAADAIGGTWRANTYPGCACDIPSVLYCYSFEPYPFSEHYSSQPEIWQYLQHCVDKYGLKPHIKLSTRITAAEFDESSGSWKLTSGNGEQLTVRALVLAQGGLAVPSTPAIPGVDSFHGPNFHSACWDHSVDLTGKQVAVVGTGASAIQIIPSIQPQVQQLHVFQRTAPWVTPRAARFPKWAVECSRGSGWFNWVQRQRWFWFMELILGRALTRNKQRFIGQIEHFSKWQLQRQVADPEMRRRLTPTYSAGCKRLLASDVYYPALCQSNVQLLTSAVKEVRNGHTIVAEDGSTAQVDVLIWATGFDLTATLHDMSIKGLGGADLAAITRKQPEAFFGVAAAGFPNLFMLNGPNTGLGHNSMIFMAECGVNCIVKLLQRMHSHALKTLEVTCSAQKRFNAEVQQRLKGSVWLSGGCRSWYQNPEGTGSFALWPGLCVEYWWRTRQLPSRTADWIAVKQGEAAGGEKAKLL